MKWVGQWWCQMTNTTHGQGQLFTWNIRPCQNKTIVLLPLSKTDLILVGAVYASTISTQNHLEASVQEKGLHLEKLETMRSIQEKGLQLEKLETMRSPPAPTMNSYKKSRTSRHKHSSSVTALQQTDAADDRPFQGLMGSTLHRV